MRGRNCAHHRVSAQVCDVRIQQELFSSFLPSRSQWNWTFTRPYWSVQISWPGGPTTIAGGGPRTVGLYRVIGGRKVTLDSIALKAQANGSTPSPLAPLTASGP